MGKFSDQLRALASSLERDADDETLNPQERHAARAVAANASEAADLGAKMENGSATAQERAEFEQKMETIRRLRGVFDEE